MEFNHFFPQTAATTFAFSLFFFDSKCTQYSHWRGLKLLNSLQNLTTTKKSAKVWMYQYELKQKDPGCGAEARSRREQGAVIQLQYITVANRDTRGTLCSPLARTQSGHSEALPHQWKLLLENSHQRYYSRGSWLFLPQPDRKEREVGGRGRGGEWPPSYSQADPLEGGDGPTRGWWSMRSHLGERVKKS